MGKSMSVDDKEKPSKAAGAGKKAEKRRRLAGKLRENLKKRKNQTRLRSRNG